MKKRVLTAIVAIMLIGGVAAPQRAVAQPYKSAIGLNLGDILGVNYKMFLGQRSALEFGLGYQFSSHGVTATAIYQYHIPLVSQFYLYVGGGVNIGAAYISHNDSRFALGISPNVGFEYSFAGAPVSLALDYQPQINFFTPCRWSVAAFKIRFKL